MSKNLILALFAFCLLTGCYKRDESHLNEKCTSGCAVFNIRVGTGNNSATPVGGALVDLVWIGPKNGPFGGPVVDIAKGYTDAHGMINMKFKPLANSTQGYFSITVKGTAEYYTSYQSLPDVKNPDTVLNTSVHLPSIAHVKLVYKNFSPKDPNDWFEAEPYFNTYGTNAWVWQYTSPDPVNYPANYFDNTAKPFGSLTYTGPTAGDQYTYFDVLIKRNGVRIDHTDSIYIPKGGTGTYLIDYQHSFQ